MKCEYERTLSAITARLFGWKDVFLYAALSLVILRLTIWKFFPHAEIFVREELSNLIVAGLSCLLFIGYLFYKFFSRGSMGSFRILFSIIFVVFCGGLIRFL